MKHVTVQEAKKLAENSLAFSLLLTNQELDDVVATFLVVMDHRRKMEADQNR